jgi:hypothetical protein
MKIAADDRHPMLSSERGNPRVVRRNFFRVYSQPARRGG